MKKILLSAVTLCFAIIANAAIVTRTTAFYANETKAPKADETVTLKGTCTNATYKSASVSMVMTNTAEVDAGIVKWKGSTATDEATSKNKSRMDISLLDGLSISKVTFYGKKLFNDTSKYSLEYNGVAYKADGGDTLLVIDGIGAKNISIIHKMGTANLQFQYVLVEFVANEDTLPKISVNPNAFDFGNIFQPAQSKEAFTVVGKRLTDSISLSTDNSNFTIDVEKMPAAGGTFNVSCTATTAGEYKGNVILTSGSVTTQFPVSANFIACVGRGTESNPFTVEDIANLSGEENIWVVGYIVGSFKKAGQMAVTEDSIKTNIALALTPDETDIKKCIAVKLGSGAVRDSLAPVLNAAALGRCVRVQGTVGAYLGTTGISSDVNASKWAWAVETLPTISIDDIDFGTVEIGRDGSYDELVVAITGKNISAEGMTLSLTSDIFALVGLDTIPAEGGNITISYTINNIKNTPTITGFDAQLIIEANGVDSIHNIRKIVPIKVAYTDTTIYSATEALSIATEFGKDGSSVYKKKFYVADKVNYFSQVNEDGSANFYIGTSYSNRLNCYKAWNLDGDQFTATDHPKSGDYVLMYGYLKEEMMTSGELKEIIATALIMVAAEDMNIRVQGGNIIVPAEQGAKISVYSLQGQILYNTIATGETIISGINAKNVIVRVGNQAAKIIL